MEEITYKTKKKKINWLSSNENSEDIIITIGDFREMVHEAEKEKGIGLSAYKEKMNVWWRNHL